MPEFFTTDADAAPVRKPWSTPRVIRGEAEDRTAKTVSSVEHDSTLGPTS